MWKIIDTITGELFEMTNKKNATRKVIYRINYHNSEFCYRHRGRHVSENAIYTIDEETKTITIKRK